VSWKARQTRGEDVSSSAGSAAETALPAEKKEVAQKTFDQNAVLDRVVGLHFC
jgi:hypothetical protein